jgi:hypothetical protein
MVLQLPLEQLETLVLLIGLLGGHLSEFVLLAHIVFAASNNTDRNVVQHFKNHLQGRASKDKVIILKRSLPARCSE